MLVLSRKAGERIYIGDNIAVSVVGVQGKRVKLAFDAPRDVAILRSELSPFQSDVDELGSETPSQTARPR